MFFFSARSFTSCLYSSIISSIWKSYTLNFVISLRYSIYWFSILSTSSIHTSWIKFLLNIICSPFPDSFELHLRIHCGLALFLYRLRNWTLLCIRCQQEQSLSFRFIFFQHVKHLQNHSSSEYFSLMYIEKILSNFATSLLLLGFLGFFIKKKSDR